MASYPLKEVHERTSIHYFVIVGLYIRKMCRYESHTNDNGKMDGATYATLLDRTYDDIEKEYGKHFILCEDGDSSHTVPEAIQAKKARNYLRNCITNPYNCPETNPIKARAMVNVVKGNIKRSPHADIAALRDLAEDGLYNKVKQEKLVGVWGHSRPMGQIRDNGGRRINLYKDSKIDCFPRYRN
jgi:hypothetical protein